MVKMYLIFALHSLRLYFYHTGWLILVGCYDDGDHDDYNDCTTILLWWCLCVAPFLGIITISRAK